MKSESIGFKAEVCRGQFPLGCAQTTNYLLPLDRGTLIIVRAFAAAIRRKGINLIHPTKEMEVPAKEWNINRALTEGVLYSDQIGNLTRAHRHGLIVPSDKESRNWLFTTKGSKFLKNEIVPRFAIVKKSTEDDAAHQDGYFEPERYTIRATELAEEEDMWMGIDFEIHEGRIVKDLPAKAVPNTLL